jgi:tellurite methyltransferase
MNGGYDSGYLQCPCFWGRTPGSLVTLLTTQVSDFRNLRILDAGCGEGKNSVFLSELGAHVRAIDISEAAIRNGKSAFDCKGNISWEVSDVRSAVLRQEEYDIVIAYGLLHCLGSTNEISEVVQKLQRATRIGGYNIVCALNSRCQDLSAHPDLNPTLLPHTAYVELYQDWNVLVVSDADLTEVHPHNNIKHTHSLTRMLARRT